MTVQFVICQMIVWKIFNAADCSMWSGRAGEGQMDKQDKRSGKQGEAIHQVIRVISLFVPPISLPLRAPNLPLTLWGVITRARLGGVTLPFDSDAEFAVRAVALFVSREKPKHVLRAQFISQAGKRLIELLE